MKQLRILLFACVFAFSAAAHAQPAPASGPAPTAPQGELNEQVFQVPVSDSVMRGGASALIVVTVFRPNGNGPFPLVVISHDSPRSVEDRRRMGRAAFEEQARAFVSRGFAVAVPTRRGYGRSGGNWAETYKDCKNPDYRHAGLETARDIIASISALAAEPFIDAKKVLLVGVAAGGFGSLAAATQPIAGLAGTINFAGGRGSINDYAVCELPKLVEAFAAFGAESRAPSLWIYAENDRSFTPAMAKQMFTAYVRAGGRGDLVLAPPHGQDGHAYFYGGVKAWLPLVDEFLAGINLKPAK
jgi:dienelactone hydrolase